MEKPARLKLEKNGLNEVQTSNLYGIAKNFHVTEESNQSLSKIVVACQKLLEKEI